jgi:regulatory protein
MKPLSLRERAIRYLAQREHSRAELARKLARYASEADEIPPLLDELVRRKLLSDDRYAEARVHSLAPRFGAARIKHELRAKGVAKATIERVADAVRSTELERARVAWAKRFGTAGASAAERARQARFLAGRGFSHDVIRKIVRGLEED